VLLVIVVSSPSVLDTATSRRRPAGFCDSRGSGLPAVG
jgi:hypothetical protein